MPMKKILLLLCSYCLMLSTIYAQTRDSIITKQRLVQCTYQTHNTDSSIMQKILLDYRYSGKRGSQFRPLSNPGSFGFNYVRFPSVQTEPELTPLPEPYNDAYKMDVSYDVVYDRQNSNSDSFLMTKYRTYDGQWLTMQMDSLSNNFFLDKIIKRDTSGRIRTIDFYSRQGNTTPFLYQYIRTSYDDKGRITSDSTCRPKDVNNYMVIKTHRYDEKGRISSTGHSRQAMPGVTLKPTLKDEYVYNDKGLLYQTIFWSLDANGLWDTTTIHTFNYDEADRMISYRIGSYYTVYNEQKYTYHYNADGDMDTLSYYLSPETKSWVTFFIYNEAHNPVFQSMSNVNPNGVPTGRWYTQDFVYENYYDTIKIPVPEITEPIVLYPNPAGSSFTIRWNKENPKRAVNVGLYNPMGQSIRKYYIASPQAEDKLDISGLASGMYYIEIITTTGGKIYRGNLAVQGWSQ